ncbi:MAG: ChbG/HpnK family deacetylase [Coprobacillus sp.]
MKQLLIRGDDLGYSEAVTLGMISAYEKGLVNSMALMVNMPYASEAVLLAKKHKGLCLGLHVNVTNGKALAPKELIPTLIDDNGVFISSRIRRQQIADGVPLFNTDEAYIEAKYQLDKYIEMVGEMPEYIDFHVLEVPELIDAVVRVYKEYEIKYCLYAEDIPAIVHEQCMKQYDYYQDHNNNFENMFIDADFQMQDGLNVVVTHPGFIDYDLLTTSSMINERLYDYSLVTSPILKKWLKDNHIEVISFRDL